MFIYCMMRIGVICIIGILLTGCFNHNQRHTTTLIKDGWGVYFNEEFQYEIGVPPTIYIANKKRVGERIVFGNIHPFNNKGHEFDLDIYGGTANNCQSIGVRLGRYNMENGQLNVTGKVDYPLDYSSTPIVPDCRPYRPSTASYILCSEKDGKQAVICVTQVTDNPNLAEEIFSTFRWKG